MLLKLLGPNWRSSISGIIAVFAITIIFIIKDINFLNNIFSDILINYILVILKIIAFIGSIIFVFSVKDSVVTGGKIWQTEEAKKRIKKEIEYQKKYTTKIESPIYEIKNKKPEIFELINTIKSDELIKEILDSDISDNEKKFLIEAAKRHVIFDYEKIADYYAHSCEKVQYLMEKSALIIIDFGKAIENGYVRLCEEIKKRYHNDGE